MASKRGNPLEAREKMAQDAADKYVAGKGYSSSSMEAVRRAAKANKLKTKVRVGNYQEPSE